MSNYPFEITPADEGIMAAAYDDTRRMGLGDDDSLEYIGFTIQQEVAPIDATDEQIKRAAFLFYCHMINEG